MSLEREPGIECMEWTILDSHVVEQHRDQKSVEYRSRLWMPSELQAMSNEAEDVATGIPSYIAYHRDKHIET